MRRIRERIEQLKQASEQTADPQPITGNGFQIAEDPADNRILITFPAGLVLDTGADATIASPQVSGLSTVKLRALTATKTTGANGEDLRSRADLRLGKRHWIDHDVLVMDVSEASKRTGAPIDGFVGQDLLRTFSAVRINYKANAVELEE